MNKQILKTILLLSFLFATTVFLTKSLYAQIQPSNIDPSVKTMADRLIQSAKGNLKFSYHNKTGKVRFMSTERGYAIPQPFKLPANATPEIAARSFLKTNGMLFGLLNQSKELKVMKEHAAEQGRSFVRFQQLHTGIPVIAGELIVQLDSDKNVNSVNGEISPAPKVSIIPWTSRNKAKQKALDLVSKDYNLAPADLIVSKPELWIYNPSLLGDGENKNILVWRMEVSTTDLSPIDELVLVDAREGDIALHFNQTPDARNRGIYDNQNNTAYGLPGNGPVRIENNAATGIADIDKAYDYAGDAYDFYATYHGRDSIDNNGMNIVATVRHCDSSGDCPMHNAYWIPQKNQMAFGTGYSLADDAVGHEYTHGITSYESNLFYYMQSGAIDESFSDTWGEFIDLTNGKGNDSTSVRWLIGEDLATGAMRSMKNPSLFNNPSYNYPDRMTSSDYFCGTADNGGVHENGSVNNKAVYLMVDGDTFNGKTVTGIGITKTAKIYYQVQTSLLTSGSDYVDLYDALQTSCNSLIGTSGITSSDCQQVKNALDAVEMDEQPTSCSADEAPICDTGTPNNLFFDDFESGGGKWSTGVSSGTNAWYLDNEYSTSGTYSLWAEDLDSSSSSYVKMTNSLTIPANAYLHFNHSYDFDTIGSNYYDGGIVAYSTNGGSNWTSAGSLFVDNGYNGIIYPSASNSLATYSAFVGKSNGYISSRLNLSSFAGQNVKFSFWIGTDSSNFDYYRGWYIDDVSIYTCAVSSSSSSSSTTSVQPTTSSTSPTTIIGVSSTTTVGVSSSTSSVPSFVWSYSTGNIVESSPTISDGYVYVGSADHKVYCLNAVTGAFVWSYDTGGLVYSSPAVSGGYVYVGGDYKVFCLNAVTGDFVWSYTTGGVVYSSPAVTGGYVYVGSNDKKVYCLNAQTGAFVWSYTTGNTIDSSPAVTGGYVYVGSWDNNVYCLNAVTGAFVWSYTTGSSVYSSPAVTGGYVYVGSFDNKVYCLNAQTGAFVWSYTTGNKVYSSPAVTGGYVYVGGADSKVYCLNAVTGAFVWSYTTGNWVFSSPAVSGGYAYVGSWDNKVYCLNAVTGAFVGSYTTGNKVYPSPAVSGGYVYVGSDDKKLYCLNAVNNTGSWTMFKYNNERTGSNETNNATSTTSQPTTTISQVSTTSTTQNTSTTIQPTTSSTSPTTTIGVSTTTTVGVSSTTTSSVPCVNDGNCPEGQMCDGGVCKTKYTLTAHIQGITGIGYIQALRGGDPLTLNDGASANYPVGSTITLTAFPVAITTSYRLFTGWQGGQSGFQNPATIVMNSNAAVTATFIQAHDVSGGNISALSFIDPSTQPITVTQNMPNSMPYGMIHVGMTLMGTATTGSFTIQLPAPAPLNAKWYKCGEKTSGCIDFSRDVISGGTGDGAVFNAERTEVTVYITDQGLYDDDPATGTIADPSGLGGACFANSDCDDGQYCNGQETCSQGQCVAGTSPCATGYNCNEQTDQCTQITSTTTATSGGGGGGGGGSGGGGTPTSSTTTTIQPTTSTSVVVTTTSTSIAVSTSTTSVAQTTTSVQPSTTTSTIKICPVSLIAEGEPEKLNILRGFRDKVLMNSAEGREYVFQFYKHSPEITSIMIMNPSIAAQSMDVLKTVMPNVQSALEGRDIAVSAMQTDKIISVLDAIDEEARLELKTRIKQIRDDLRQGRLFNELGIKKR